MKVYLDCSPLTNTQVSGIGVYNKNLFNALRSHLNRDVLPVLKWSRLGKKSIVESHLEAEVKALPPILLNKKTVYHGTDHKLNTHSLGPTVVTIHDMQPFVGKWLDQKFTDDRVSVIRNVLESDVTRIIAISEFTKKEIIRFFPHTEKKIEVVYHGHNFKPSAALSNKNIIAEIAGNRPFLFFVGHIEERKNLINQLKAFEILKEKNPDLIFILSGKDGYKAIETKNYIERSRYKKDIFVTGYLSDFEKEYAMKHTSCFMFVSFYEGFGMPVIEALATNTNIVVSNNSSLDEIGKGYCQQCNPFDPEEIAQKVQKVMLEGNLKKVDPKEWANEWSWDKCARKTIEVYRKIYM